MYNIKEALEHYNYRNYTLQDSFSKLDRQITSLDRRVKRIIKLRLIFNIV